MTKLINMHKIVTVNEREEIFVNNKNNCNPSNSRKTDFGPEPFSVNIKYATCNNNDFRRALWSGCHLQLTLMSIPQGGEIGLEMHTDTDQFLRIESGSGAVKMGPCKEKLNFNKCINAGDAVIVPAGIWHNIINKGGCPLKIYSLYAPPKHPHGTVHKTKEISDASGD